MRVLKGPTQTERFLRRLARRSTEPSPQVLRTVEGILRAVRRRGDEALRRYTLRLDGHQRLRASPQEIARWAQAVEAPLLRALGVAARRIRAFHKRQLLRSWFVKDQGAVLGQLVRPLQRVGVYVPGGLASYPSSVLMNVIPAQVAGVREIALVVPTPRGQVNPAVMAAVKMLGLKEVYTIGGAQAVAALAYGTESIRPVEKIVGPGNIYVATAKRLVFGVVDIDMVAGPSEILVLADETAPPAFVAADLLSQAEHDPMASAVLVSTSEALAQAVRKELQRQLRALPKAPVAQEALRRWGAIILVRDIQEALEVVNRIAPEHLELMCRHPRAVLKGVRNAGAVFLGPWSPEPLGDYVAGPNHTLPTGGTARFFSPLGVYDFLKHSSLLQFSRKAFEALAPWAEALAQTEGLQAHAQALRVRLKRQRESP